MQRTPDLVSPGSVDLGQIRHRPRDPEDPVVAAQRERTALQCTVQR
jgi:hypothetical protein